VTLSLSSKAVEHELMRKMMASGEIEHHVEHVAHEAQHFAKELANEIDSPPSAPVFGETESRPPKRKKPPIGEIGDYKNSIVVERIKGKPNMRRLISRDYKAIWIEIGTRHMPEFAIFTKTARHFGSKTGPHFTNEGGGRTSMHDELVKKKHDLLRGALDDLKGLILEEAPLSIINSQRNKIDRLRNERSAAFRAAQPRSRRRRR